MGQILALDYGGKRCGLAATDDMRIIASGLDTVPTEKLFSFFEQYFSWNKVDILVVGQPVDLRGNPSEIEQEILVFIQKFEALFPAVEVRRLDERFTSKIASHFISQSGKNKKQREKKELIDKVSATILLQNFLEQIQK